MKIFLTGANGQLGRELAGVVDDWLPVLEALAAFAET